MSDQNAPTASAIVTLVDGIPMTTTLAIAEGAAVEHKSVIQLVRTYVADMEEFGRVAFEMQPFATPGGVQKREIARLNEQQATLLFTYMRNSEIVRAFKKRLVKEFYVLAGRSSIDPVRVIGDRPAKVFPEYFRIAKLIGLDKNAAAISANQATIKKTGENVLALMGIEHLETEQPWFTPTELGQRIDVNGRRFNLLLLECGLQTKEGDHWLPTDSAKGMYRFFDTGKRHGDGTAVQQLKWSCDVLGKINREAA